MKWFILLVGVVVVCFFVALLLGWAGGGMGRPTASLRHERLPEGDLHDDDLEELTFDVSFRGYRMSQVDGVLDRLRRELRDKDEHISYLRGMALGGERAEDPDALGDGEATDVREALEAVDVREDGKSTEAAEASEPDRPLERVDPREVPESTEA